MPGTNRSLSHSRLTRGLAAVAITASAIALLFISCAGEARASNGAGIARDFNCRMYDASRSIVLATDSQATNTKNGTTLVCQTTVSNPTGQAITISGFPCSAGGVLTTDTHETIGASGNATMTCHSHF